MRALALLAAAALALAAYGQDKAPAPKKKAAASQVVHKKPTPQQLRRFDELEKKREAKQQKK